MALLLGNEVRKLTSGVVVNAMVGASTSVFPAFTKDVVITSVVFRCTAATAVATPATIKVEKNPAAGDIFSAEQLTAVTAVGDIWVFSAEAKGLLGAAGTTLDVTVTVAATGTTLTLAADVIGYIIY
jgi:hypothetical protein